jgi:hypothetical protein
MISSVYTSVHYVLISHVYTSVEIYVFFASFFTHFFTTLIY